jgi:oleate hydratase
VRHLGFDADLKQILDSSNVLPCRMPFVTSQFLKRKVTDRPDVVPKGSTNLALTGQFVEVPDDCVFTMEYSVRSAQMAVFKLLNAKDIGITESTVKVHRTNLMRR